MSETGFWLVWNPNGSNPTRTHSSLDAAQAEAERLARTNPGSKLYVLAGVSVSISRDVETVNLKPPELPF